MKVSKEVLKSLAICLTAKTMTEDEFVEKVSTLLEENDEPTDIVNTKQHLVEDLYHDVINGMDLPKILKYMTSVNWCWINKPVTGEMIKEEIKRQIQLCVDGIIRSAAQYGYEPECWEDEYISYTTSCGGFTTRVYLTEEGNIEGECLFAIESNMLFSNNYSFEQLVKTYGACRES